MLSFPSLPPRCSSSSSSRFFARSSLVFFGARVPLSFYHEVPRGSTVGRFTYKFNKHISYLIHAQRRERFDHPEPFFSSSDNGSDFPLRLSPSLVFAFTLFLRDRCVSGDSVASETPRETEGRTDSRSLSRSRISSEQRSSLKRVSLRHRLSIRGKSPRENIVDAYQRSGYPSGVFYYPEPITSLL